MYLLLSLSRSSTASCVPVEAPEGTAARPKVPFSVTTSTSTVGFPRESSICRACTSKIKLIFLVLFYVKELYKCIKYTIGSLFKNTLFKRNAKTNLFPLRKIGRSYAVFPISCTNSSNKYRESCGPGEDSGWYCTEKAFLFFMRIPSIDLSFKLTWVISTLSELCTSSGTTPKPWFCEVTSQ